MRSLAPSLPRSLAPSLPRSLARFGQLTALSWLLFSASVAGAQGPPEPVYYLSNLGLLDGQDLHVLPGTTVIMDMEPSADLSGVLVEGQLLFDTSLDFPELRAEWILVGTSDSSKACQIGIGTGSSRVPSSCVATITLLQQGTQTLSPAAAVATIESNSGPAATMLAALQDGGLVIYEYGRLLAFGADFGVSWTQLAVKGDLDDTSLEVVAGISDVQDWAGKQIVLASTDYDPDQAQLFDVGSVSNSGSHPILALDGTNLDNSLNSDHYALSYTASNQGTDPDWTIEEIAEVGLLTRNMIIRAETWDDPVWVPGTGSYGHVMLMRDTDGQLPTARVSWVQFLNLGVKGKMMRYPLHFHMTGEQDTLDYPSLVKDCRFTFCFNKFLVLHDTQDMEVSGNVGYDTIGNGFYLEDSGTTGITLSNNLGLGIQPASYFDGEEPVGDEDLSPAVFYYTSANNKISDNHAAGSSDYGFWYYPDNEDEFIVDDPNSFFKDNVGHSNAQHGFYQDKNLSEEDELIPPRARPWYESTDTPQLMDCQFYKNRRYGVWIRSYGRVYLARIKVADNRSGYYFASDGIQNVVDLGSNDYRSLSYITLQESLAIGETNNYGKKNDALAHEYQAGRSLPQRLPFRDWSDRTHNIPWAALSGVDIYDGLIELYDVKFADFQDIGSLAYDAGTLGGQYYSSGSADRKAAAFSQVAYDSQYVADPRNRVELIALESVAHPVFFRYPADAVKGANMIKNTILFDVDDSLGYGIGYIIPADEPLLAAGATSSSTTTSDGVRFVAVDDANYASLVVEALDGTEVPTWMRVLYDYPPATPAIAQLVHDTQKENEYLFPLSIGLDSAYTLLFKDVNEDNIEPPTELLITVRFAERIDDANTQPFVIIGIPWGTTAPGTVEVDDAAASPVASLNALESAGADSYYWHSANRYVVVKMFLKWPTGYDDDNDILTTGTQNTCYIWDQ